jgi:hypothetical protein
MRRSIASPTGSTQNSACVEWPRSSGATAPRPPGILKEAESGSALVVRSLNLNPCATSFLCSTISVRCSTAAGSLRSNFTKRPAKSLRVGERLLELRSCLSALPDTTSAPAARKLSRYSAGCADLPR